MNVGEFKDKISVLELIESANMYSWEVIANPWAKAERLKTNNIFSKIGISAKSVKFTMRKRGLTCHNALRWQGKHCFITDIVEVDRMYYEVTAALVETRICTVERTGKLEKDSLNRPIYGDAEQIMFPGCLIEKYLGHTQDKPMTLIEIGYVLVTPKVIELTSGKIVSIDNMQYTVTLPHTLDEYKNEYEILRKVNP